MPDWQRAAQLDPKQWRYGAMLARHYLKREATALALAVADDYTRRFPSNDSLALLRAKALLLTGQYRAAAEFLSSLHVLPAEGTTEAHALFREAHLLLAVEQMKAGEYDDALRLVGQQQVEQLGAGKPYPADVDERLEDWLTAQCDLALHDTAKARQALDRILAIPSRAEGQGTGDLIRALALKQAGHRAEAKQLLKAWQARDPRSDLAVWGRKLFAGHSSALPASLTGLDCRVLTGIARTGIHPKPLPASKNDHGA